MNKIDEWYVSHIISQIEKMKKTSIDNTPKTDLYSTTEIIEFMEWFERIKQLIYIQPPKQYVSHIILKVKDESIIAIDYKYCTDKNEDIELVVQHDSQA